MKEVAPNVQRIINWRESFATLPDNHFFELIRMYLGEVHTPFNKPKLIEELSAFLRKEEHRDAIVSLLDKDDLQLLCAVWFIQNATQEKLAQFFEASYSFAEVYERLLNLEERLLVYRHGDKKSGKIIISVNPMLEETLRPYINRSVLLTPAVLTAAPSQPAQALTPELLAAYCSFLYETPDVCKSDGTFKKRSLTQLEQLFPQHIELLHSVTVAFVNLAILREESRGFVLDTTRLDTFARLGEISQYALLCIASQGRFSRTAMQRQGELLLNSAASIPASGFTRAMLLRSAFLIAEADNDIPGIPPIGQRSRFSTLLARSLTPLDDGEEDAVSLLDRLIDSAVQVGILCELGTDAQGETVYGKGAALLAQPRVPAPLPKVLNIDAGFTVTLLPGLPLATLLPLMRLMELQQFDTAATFEITKKAIMRAFDADMSQEQILSLLESVTPYELPQNLRISIEDWHNAYTVATVYHGYILKVREENIAAVERNRRIKSNLIATLSPGVYLLDAQSDLEAQFVLRKLGLDYVGKIRGVEKPREILSFPEIRATTKTGLVSAPLEIRLVIANAPAQDAHEAQMRAALDALNVTPEQKDGLLDRIQRKIVIDPVQLRGESVRLERLEAGAMDFAGKIHVIDSAINSHSMVELEFDPANAGIVDAGTEPVVYMGNPLSLEKQGGDAFVRVELIPQHEEKLFSIGKARHVKRIRGSVLR